MMALLLEKTLEYLKYCDSNCELVITEIATLYEVIIDKTLLLTKVASKINAAPNKTI